MEGEEMVGVGRMASKYLTWNTKYKMDRFRVWGGGWGNENNQLVFRRFDLNCW